MSKIALIFPGQGAQTVGMGKDLYDKYSRAREIIDLADSELKKIIFNGPEETLRLTHYTQPAIFTVSVAAFETFKESFKGGSSVEFIAAGHSLGEYSALCAAGFFEFADGLAMVKARGEFIQKAAEKNPGLMVAILGMEKSAVEDVCKKASRFGVCEAVNFNSSEQIVIAGTISAINKAVRFAIDAGATKTVFLNVSGPFHSSLMTSASEKMAEELAKYNFNAPSFGVYTNCDAAFTFDVSVIKEKLVKQIMSPVNWDESMKNIIAAGFDKFVEIGPGRVLSRLLKRMNRYKKVLNVDDSKSLQRTLEDLNI
ncbi:MAG: ACP S-malonyltransferase [Endomicrobium sp.]|jgi:[acyl-carrier-protein] S-malonyltransferase|nr:ACP S-malonyltransferase [Endomicrobium sp.]